MVGEPLGARLRPHPPRHYRVLDAELQSEAGGVAASWRGDAGVASMREGRGSGPKLRNWLCHQIHRGPVTALPWASVSSSTKWRY